MSGEHTIDIYVCAHVYTHVYTYIHTCIHIQAHICMQYVCIHDYICICNHVHFLKIILIEEVRLILRNNINIWQCFLNQVRLT